MKQKKKHLRLLPLLLMLTLFFSMTAHAEEKEGNIYYVNQDGQSFLISILYEKNDVKVSLKDPENNPVALDAGNVTVLQDEGSMLIYVENAKAGQWKLVYDKGSNAEIQVAAYACEEPVYLSELTVGAPDGENKVSVSFRADHEPASGFHYEIRLGTDETMTEYRVLMEGDGNTGETTSVSVPFDTVNSYEAYYLQVFAILEKDGLRYFDIATSDAFAYTNPAAPDAIEDYNVTVNLTNHTVTVDVGEFAGDASMFEFTLFEDGQETGKTLMDRSSANDASLQYGDAPQELRCSVTLRRGDGLVTQPKEKVIYLTPQAGAFSVTLPESGHLVAYSYPITYENAKDNKVYYQVDSGNKEELTLNGSGVYSVPLEKGNTSMEVSYTNDERVTFVCSQILAIDTMPPTLTIYESLNGTRTDDSSVILTGKTEPGAVVRIGEEAVEVAEDGGFSKELSLEQGKNTFQIEAEDQAGNVSTYIFTITRGSAASEEGGDSASVGERGSTGITGKIGRFYWPGILGYIGLMLLTAFLLFFIGRKKRERRTSIARTSRVILIFSGVGFLGNLVYFLMRRSFQNSKKYIDLAYADSEKAYKYLNLTDAVNIFMWVFLGLAAASLVTMLIAGRTKKVKKDWYASSGQN